MSKNSLVKEFESAQIKQDIPPFNIGDTVSVHTRIKEGDKERVQVFTGTVIARKGGSLGETFSLHRIAYGEGMEKVFLLHSPRIEKIEVTRLGKVRRSKLYYLRGQYGKAAKVPGVMDKRRTSKKKNVATKVVAEVSSVELVDNSAE